MAARYKDAVFDVAFHPLGEFEEARDLAQDALIDAGAACAAPALSSHLRRAPAQ
jgi:hypothetical protein